VHSATSLPVLRAVGTRSFPWWQAGHTTGRDVFCPYLCYVFITLFDKGTRAHWTPENTTLHLARRLNGVIYIDELDFVSVLPSVNPAS
jgi:hypothetical protein